MANGIPLLFFLLFRLASSRPVLVERDGTTYALNSGLCEDWSCGQEEGRGICTDDIFSGRPSHYCTCNLPFVGAYCDDSLRLNATLPGAHFSQCAFPTYCAAVYRNGECNQECNTVECLYDGYECQLPATCLHEEYCRDRFSDGVCDEKCMGEECQFDGDDCFSQMDTLPGQLLVRLSITAHQFMHISHLFLFQLSLFLRSTIVLSQDNKGPLLWAWSADGGRGQRIIFGENSSSGIEVALSLDLRRCSHECLDSVERASGFIDRALAAKVSPVSSALIRSVSYSSIVPSSPSYPPLWLCVVIPLVIVSSLIIGVVVQHRRTRKRVLEAPVWFPPEIGGVATAVQPVKRTRPSHPSPTHLHRMAEDILPLLITNDDDVNARDERGRTPLMLAIRSKRNEEALREAVTALNKEGADLTAVDGDGWAVLHHSFHKLRSPNFNRWLISLGASPMVVDGKGRSLVHLATEYCDLPNLQMILETGALRLIDSADDSNRLALSMAVSDCPLSITRCLIDHGANLNTNGEKQFDASVPQRSPLHLAVQYNNKDHVKLLISKGCRMDVLDNRHRTALHYAVLAADLSMCRIIVDAGTRVDAVDDENRTAQDIAVEWSMIEIQQYLASVRGNNEPYKSRRKAKRYSMDQGYGSEESQHQSMEEMSGAITRSDSPPLPPLILTPRHSFGIPEWGNGAQLPIFHTGPLTPLTRMAAPLHTSYLSVLTPPNKLLRESSCTLDSPPSILFPDYNPHL